MSTIDPVCGVTVTLHLTEEEARTLGQLLFKARLGFQRDARSNTKHNTCKGLIAARFAADMADRAVAFEAKLTEARTGTTPHPYARSRDDQAVLAAEYTDPGHGPDDEPFSVLDTHYA